MASVFLASILSKTSQVSGCVRRWAVLPSSSSDPRSSISKDLKKLERTLKRIQAVLHDAEEREIREQAVKLRLEELKEVAYDAEDVLDEYQYDELRAQVEGRASRERKRVEGDDEEEVSIPNGMGDRIREIRERFDEISKEWECLSLKEEDGERRVYKTTYPEPTSHMVDESSIYGRERDKQEIIDLLFSEGVGNGISVISIVGKGGLGKTTIAQLVYNDPKVKQYFHLTGWVCVSDDFDVPRLTKDIIESLTRSPCDLTQLSTLQDELKEKVMGQRVLLVLDDIWNEQQCRWESLRNPFVGAETVAIIVTCRNDSVAEIMQTVRPYRPGILSPEQSWLLFRHYAFGGREPEEQPRLGDMGKQIVEKCSGLPLAVKSIGSLLRYTAYEDSWMDIVQSDIWEVDENNEILPALRLSYNRMAAHLKPCFIYCSMFPKGYRFGKVEFVHLWMAQGYIPSGGRRTMEDIGQEYLNDLQRRSFIESYGCYFKMHDMIHDLAKSIAGNECCAIVDKKLPDLSNKVRHLYAEDKEGLLKSLGSYNLSALRTLLAQERGMNPMVIPEINKYLLRLKCLRTLQFCWERDDEIPDLLGNLKHLRYLCIRAGNIKKLPESICLLYHLQELVLYCDKLAELPNGLGNLTNLQELDIVADRILCLPAGIGKLTNLQWLRGYYELQGGIGVLKDLKNLQGILRISGLRNLINIEDARDAGLKHKHKLKELILAWDSYDNANYGLHVQVPEGNEDVPAKEKWVEDMLEYLQPHANLKKLRIEGYGGSKFPEWVGNPLSFASLQTISIIRCKKIRSFPLYIHDSLGKSGAPISKSMLERVYIFGCLQLTSIIGLHNLHSLKELEIRNCPQLLILSEEGLPSKLENLHIEECQELTSLPGTQNLTSLRELNIKNCPQLRLLSEERLSSNLQDLHIVECQQLASLPGMQNLTSLRTLYIKNCPQLRLLSEEGLPSNLECLTIKECQLLMSLLGMQNLTSLENLSIGNCPKLQIMAEDQLSYMPKFVEIVDCPGFSNWCQIQNINCIQVASGNKLTISNTWEYIMHGFDDLTSIDRLYFGSRWDAGLRRYPIFVLKELTIWSCADFPPVWDLANLTFLRSLVIKDCPGIQRLPYDLLPSTLKSLVVDSCDDLRDLPLAQQNRYAFEELQLVNCPKLERVEGLNCDFFPKILRIERCPQLLLPQDDRQPSIPPRVEIADDCDMGRCSSESPVQITAEASLADKKHLAMMQDNDCNHDKNPLYDNFLFSHSTMVDHLTTRMESMESISSNLPRAASITDPGPSRPWQMPLAEPPLICPQQQDLAVAFPDSQPFKPTTRQSDATVTFIDHDHSAVSPIFDEADEGDMGEVLQLLLPSDCISQSLVQITAEPSLADKELLAMMQDNDNFSLSFVVIHLTTWMESVGSRSSNLPCVASITDPGPSKSWQMPLAEPPLICPQQQDLAIAFPNSQPFKPTARHSDATMTFIDHDHRAVSPIFDEATDCGFLQLLPSGCSSQSSVHNNAEPSDQVHALVNVTSELPDNELLLQKHFIAILSSVWRAKCRVERCQSMPSSRHSFHSSKLTIDSSGKNSRRPTEKMKLANLRQSSKLVMTAIADSYREHQEEPVVLSSQPEACSIIDQLDLTLNFSMDQVNHDTAFPSSITVSIRGPEPRQEDNVPLEQYLLAESSCRTAENRYRQALGACFEGEGSGWALPAFPPADIIRYKSGSKSQSLGKHKVASDSTMPPKSEVQRATELHEDSGLISKFLLPSSRQTTPLESYSLPHLILDSGSDFFWFPAMDAFPQETEGFGLVPHEYDPNFFADLEDSGSLLDIIDIGWCM